MPSSSSFRNSWICIDVNTSLTTIDNTVDLSQFPGGLIDASSDPSVIVSLKTIDILLSEMTLTDGDNSITENFTIIYDMTKTRW